MRNTLKLAAALAALTLPAALAAETPIDPARLNETVRP